MSEQAKERPIITDRLVVDRTGASMEEWFRRIDELGARKMTPGQVYDLLETIDGLEPLGQWNRGLLGTSYQWSRGIRKRGQKAGGFEISVSKTVAVPVEVLYAAFVDEGTRKKWLPDAIDIRKATENKSARVTWSDGETSLSVDLYPKGDSKSQIVVQHLKIPGAEMAASMKEFWAERLTALKGLLTND